MKKIGILASTKATDLDSVVEAEKQGVFEAEISLLVSDRKDALCVERAGKHGIEAIFLNPKEFSSREEFDKAIIKELEKKKIDFIVCIGYMRLLSSLFVQKYKNRILNIHPSLLPAFPGMDLDVHKAVLEAGCKITGCTAHLIDEGKDSGAIVLQKVVEVKENDTPESLKERVQKAEQELLPIAIKLLIEDKIVVDGKHAFVRE